jgi:hypothetical protein
LANDMQGGFCLGSGDPGGPGEVQLKGGGGGYKAGMQVGCLVLLTWMPLSSFPPTIPLLSLSTPPDPLPKTPSLDELGLGWIHVRCIVVEI